MNDLARAGLLIAFLTFIGVRRFLAGRELRPIKPKRFLLRVLIIGSVTVSLTWFLTPSLPVLAGGLTLGLLLGLYSLKLTSLEPGVDRTMFKPHPQIGNLLFVLFAIRVGWRVGRQLFSDLPIGHRLGLDAPDRPPWTTLLVLVLMGYAMTYTVGLVVRGRSIPRLPETANESATVAASAESSE